MLWSALAKLDALHKHLKSDVVQPVPDMPEAAALNCSSSDLLQPSFAAVGYLLRMMVDLL